MRATFVTLFPGFFVGPMQASILGRAVECGALSWSTTSPRDFARDRHRGTDDTPYGGGAGMLMKPDVLADSVRDARERNPAAPVILLSPQGAPFRQSHAQALAAEPGVIFVCGRYEGVDERFVERCVDYELSLGDFVLSGGEPAALVVVDAIVRLLPGVLGNEASALEESFSDGLLEHPQFTRPRSFEGLEVPQVLTGGDHGRVAKWRRKASFLRTEARRPDLVPAELSRKDAKILADSRLDVPRWLIDPRHMETAVDDSTQSCILRRPDVPGPRRPES